MITPTHTNQPQYLRLIYSRHWGWIPLKNIILDPQSNKASPDKTGVIGLSEGLGETIQQGSQHWRLVYAQQMLILPGVEDLWQRDAQKSSSESLSPSQHPAVTLMHKAVKEWVTF